MEISAAIHIAYMVVASRNNRAMHVASVHIAARSGIAIYDAFVKTGGCVDALLASVYMEPILC